ncbi:MAG: C4-dicarboxylate transporter DctA [Sporocytophaga sp.]|nr:C4-dicarboxylate transporter DctA [Sporocytophaga sp.]
METVSAKKFYHTLYFYVLIAIVAGVLTGYFFPSTGAKLKPLGDAFIKLIKMIVPGVIFTTVASGIASVKENKKIGRIGFKAFVYFEVMSTLALVIGLIVAKFLKPGKGMNVNPVSLDISGIESYTESAKKFDTTTFFLDIIPDSFFGAFAEGNILQVLFLGILSGFAISRMGTYRDPLVKGIDYLNHFFFRVVSIILKAAPVGAFGAMAFTIGKYGIESLLSLGELMASVYLTCLFFVFVILGIICWLSGFSIIRILKYIKEEIFLVLGTSSSEPALPGLMKKMEKAGCSQSITGLVIPAGYTFNLDGTSIYLTMATMFIAYATNTPISLWDEIALLGILMLTSKGAAAVTGGGFIVLAATLSSIDKLPVAGIALLLGVDRFMSEARAITNLIGNTVATLVIAKWEKEFKPGEFSENLK